MRSRSRLEALERKDNANEAPIFVWCNEGEEEDEAWQNAFSDIPMPKSTQVHFVRWLDEND